MQIAPIKDLKDGAAISAKCHEIDEPIFITKNGYGDMVIMSTEVFEKYESILKRSNEREAERQRELDEITRDFRNSLKDYRDGKCVDARAAIAELRGSHAV